VQPLIPRHKLKTTESAAIATLCCGLVAGVTRFDEKYAAAVSRARDSLAPKLTKWVEATEEYGIGLLSGLAPTYQLPPTPMRSAELDHEIMPEDVAFGAVAALFGCMGTMEGKVCRRIVHNVYPTTDDLGSQLGASQVALDWHVEDGFHPNRADWLVLYCLRGNPSVTTHFARLSDIRCDQSIEQKLRSTPFQLKVDESFESPFACQSFSVYSIHEHLGVSSVVFDPAYTTEIEPGSLELIEELRRRFASAQSFVSLSAGDFLVLSNRRVVHARGIAPAKFDGTDRWLKRGVVWAGVARNGLLRDPEPFPSISI